jgi:hypothetical protein
VLQEIGTFGQCPPLSVSKSAATRRHTERSRVMMTELFDTPVTVL